jgi:hypothetical protein
MKFNKLGRSDPEKKRKGGKGKKEKGKDDPEKRG